MRYITRTLLSCITLTLVCACSSFTLQQPSDQIDALKPASDHGMIREDISQKQQRYQLDRTTVKTRYRLRLLKRYGAVSASLLKQYQNKQINRNNYDKRQIEIKYIIQRAIHMMKDEADTPIPHRETDTVYQYLKENLHKLKTHTTEDM